MDFYIGFYWSSLYFVAHRCTYSITAFKPFLMPNQAKFKWRDINMPNAFVWFTVILCQSQKNNNIGAMGTFGAFRNVLLLLIWSVMIMQSIRVFISWPAGLHPHLLAHGLFRLSAGYASLTTPTPVHCREKRKRWC